MTWRERIKPAAYTSPESRRRIAFDFENVSREFDKLTAGFNFRNVGETYVQDNGFSGRRYPMRCFFSGDNHDLAATAFEAALLESGVGSLEHPFYGRFDVVPFGTITRRDDLKSAANQTVVEVTFWTTTGILYPSAQRDPRNEILAAMRDFDLKQGLQFERLADLRTSLARSQLKNSITEFNNRASDTLGEIAATTESVNRAFRDVESAINGSLDVLVGQPLLLAQQMQNLIRTPARAVTGIQSRILGYADFADRTFASGIGRPGDQTSSIVTPRRAVSILNSFLLADVAVLNAVGGTIDSVLNNTFTDKPDAMRAAELVLGQLDAANAWREAGFDVLGEIDPGGAYQEIQNAASLAAGLLVEISFSLKPERRIVLSEPRTMIDLVAELYGSVDDRLDFFIQTNSLTGSEMIELPRGRLIVYYA